MGNREQETETGLSTVSMIKNKNKNKIKQRKKQRERGDAGSLISGMISGTRLKDYEFMLYLRKPGGYRCRCRVLGTGAKYKTILGEDGQLDPRSGSRMVQQAIESRGRVETAIEMWHSQGHRRD